MFGERRLGFVILLLAILLLAMSSSIENNQASNTSLDRQNSSHGSHTHHHGNATDYREYGPIRYGTKSAVEMEGGNLTVETPPVSVLPPHTHRPTDRMYSPGHYYIRTTNFTAPRDMWITDYRISMVNAPRSTLHHALVRRVGEEGLMMTWGRDSSFHVSVPEPYGVFVSEGTVLHLEVMVHNPRPPYGPGGTYENVSFRLEMGVVNNSSRHKNVVFHLLGLRDGSSPSGTTFTVPAGKGYYIKKADSRFARHVFSRSGTIVGMGAHLHAWEGGRNVSVYRNEELLHEFRSVNVSSTPWRWRSDPVGRDVPVEKNDVLEIRSAYEQQDTRLRGAMGMVGFYFAPDDAKDG